MHCCALLDILNQNLNLKFHQMDFLFEFLDININEKKKKQLAMITMALNDKNIYPILIVFLFDLIHFLAWGIMIAPNLAKKNGKNRQK